MRTAYLVLLQNSDAIDALNAIRWLACPGPRRPVHVTLRGPYPANEDPVSAEDLESLAARLAGTQIGLSGTGQFAKPRRATVFLHVVGEHIIESSHAPGRRPYFPHATLYSGRHTELAADLERVVGRMPPLTATIADISPVTVGVVSDPIDVTVLGRPAVDQWLVRAGLAAAELQVAGPELRLRAVGAIVSGLAEERSGDDADGAG